MKTRLSDALARCDRSVRASARPEHHLSREPTGQLVVHSHVGHLRYRGACAYPSAYVSFQHDYCTILFEIVLD